MEPGSQVPPHYYRLKAVDDVKTLGKYELGDKLQVIDNYYV